MKITQFAATYLMIFLAVISCSSNRDIYDQNDASSRQGNNYQNQNPYQQRNQPYQQNPYQQKQYQQPYSQNPYRQPYTQNPYQQNPYQQQYQQPGSRYYSNPYTNQPQQSPYFYGYDADQYYVPPIGYGTEYEPISGTDRSSMYQ